ncbi:MAG: phytoene desaturase family protein [Gemmatimonadota bacterium]|nr:phytoene desaturase family protein [Gemmatimonadota bacterium]
MTIVVAPHVPAVPNASGRRRTHVLVIGAGIGGLASAVRLAQAGYRVTLAERHDVPGGRAGVWRSEGFTFDTGPSLVMMLECWHDLFRTAGRRLEDYVSLVQCDPAYRLHFTDGSTFEMTSSMNRLVDNVERLEPGAGARVSEWLAETGKLYHGGLRFIRRNMHNPLAMMDIRALGPGAGATALGDLQRLARRHFRDERLQQAITFQTLYLGISPYRSPGVYGLLAHAEMAGGIHYPMGGMHQLPRALERLGGELGVEYLYDTEITGLERDAGRIIAARTSDGRRLTADLFVANSDLPWTYQALLGEKTPTLLAPSFGCSVVLLYLGVNRQYPQVLHHNLAVTSDLRESCEALFQRREMPDEPPFYLVASTRTDPGQAPPGCENLFVLALAPSQDPRRPLDWSTLGPQVEARTIERLERFGLTNLRRHIVTRNLVTPDTFTRRYGNLRGEAFGLDHGLSQIGYFRPHNRHRRHKNLYFVGQSTHPGCGLPMVLISAECLAERVRRDVPA